MRIRPVALFPGRLTQQKRRGFRVRGKGRHVRTQISCSVEQRAHGNFAVPIFLPGDEVEAPAFRLQLEVPRVIFTNPRRTAVVLQPVAEKRPVDPEQRLLRPMWHDDVRMTFEFVSGDILSVCSDGTRLLRHAAIDPRTGELGTEDLSITREFDALIERCYGELSSKAPIFDSGKRVRPEIPGGRPDLGLGGVPSRDVLILIETEPRT